MNILSLSAEAGATNFIDCPRTKYASANSYHPRICHPQSRRSAAARTNRQRGRSECRPGGEFRSEIHATSRAVQDVIFLIDRIQFFRTEPPVGQPGTMRQQIVDRDWPLGFHRRNIVTFNRI